MPNWCAPHDRISFILGRLGSDQFWGASCFTQTGHLTSRVGYLMKEERQEPPPLAPPTPLLHPYRKRKFFYELATLLGEDKPTIRSFRDAFPARNTRPSADTGHFEPATGPNHIRGNGQRLREPSVSSARSHDTTGSNAIASTNVSSADCSEGDAAPPLAALSADTSFNDSLQDSLLFLHLSGDPHEQHAPHDDGDEAAMSGFGRSASAVIHETTTTTVLVNEELVVDAGLLYGSAAPRQCPELVDYYDSDRMCELSPCWLRSDQSSCAIHPEEVRRPMLLFCLQALDEFIAWNAFQSRERQWIVCACKLARAQLARVWEQHLLHAASPLASDIRLDDFVTRKAELPGVSRHVWHVVAQYWNQYRHNYLHQQELFFADARDAAEAGRLPATWARVRRLLHIYGLKLHQASRLAAEDPVTDALKPGAAGSVHLTDHQLAVIAQGYASIDHIAFGIQYLEGSGGSREGRAAPAFERPVISQQDWKLAFNTIVIHLQKWNASAQVFPCGSFSRGAAFGSVLNVLVAVPEAPQVHDGNPFSNSGVSFNAVMGALVAAGIVEKRGNVQRLGSYRGVCSIQFKTGRLLLDLKVLPAPASWLALVYFTGPELFVIDFFSALLKKSLRELTQPTFECTYANVVELYGPSTMSAIASEKDVFDLIEREYLSPTDRF